MAYGTLTVADLLNVQDTVVAFGEDRVYQSIDIARQAHNALVREKFATLVDVSDDRRRRYGGPASMTMERLGEFGTPNLQKISAGSNVDFPLYLNGIAVGWTRKYFQNASVQEFTQQFVAAQDADVAAIERDIKQAIFTPTNRSVVDRLVNNSVTLAVKALVNADSADVPTAPDGTNFTGSTHTHYLYTAGVSLAASDVTALLDTVLEHFASGQLMLYINKAQEAALRLLTGFEAIVPTAINGNVITPSGDSLAIQGGFDVINTNNRRIGYFGTNYAEVWVKPWVPSGYLFAYMQGVPDKPLVFRTRSGQVGDLVIAAEDEDHPMRARYMEREYGIGVWTRTNGACLYIDTGNTDTFVTPTIT